MGLDMCEMPTIATMIAGVGGDRLRPLTGFGLERDVCSLALAETLGDVDLAPPDALVLLTRAASGEAGTYRFDVALRRSVERGIAGIALAAAADDVLSRSARAVADRAHLAMLAVVEGADLAELAAALGALLRGDAAASLESAAAGVRVLDRARDAAEDVSGTLAAVGAALPGAALGEPMPELLAEPIEVDGIREAWLVAPGGGAIEILLLRAGAADVATAMGRVRREQDAPVRSRSELLTELLATEPGRDASLLRRGRALGLPVDAWHTVTLVGFDEGISDDPVHVEELRRAVERTALAAARAVSGTWHLARSEGHVVLVRDTDAESGARGATAVHAAGAAVQTVLEERFPRIAARVGIGGEHLGPAGLRASAGEARAALAAARPGQGPAVFDASGLRAMLAEWYATDSARRSVSTLLEPLEQLGGRRAEEAIGTLQVYLEEQGSVSRAARRLHLHRNAVGYRIRRIADRLDVDLADPEARLALQLACRARLLT